MSISSMVLRYFQGLHHFLPSAVCRSDDFPLLKVGIWLYQRPKRCLLVMPEFDKVLTRSCTGKPGCWMVYGLILAVDRAQPQPSFFVFFSGSPSATCPTSIITLSARGWGPKIDQNWMMGTFIGKYRAPLKMVGNQILTTTLSGVSGEDVPQKSHWEKDGWDPGCGVEAMSFLPNGAVPRWEPPWVLGWHGWRGGQCWRFRRSIDESEVGYPCLAIPAWVWSQGSRCRFAGSGRNRMDESLHWLSQSDEALLQLLLGFLFQTYLIPSTGSSSFFPNQQCNRLGGHFQTHPCR